jgi:hypothetical protein
VSSCHETNTILGKILGEPGSGIHRATTQAAKLQMSGSPPDHY